jgi:hypothetical protein
MNEVLNAWNNELIVGGILCDLEKAYDCVIHDILTYCYRNYTETCGTIWNIILTLKADIKEF